MALRDYLERRVEYLKREIKIWPSDSAKSRCAQARLYEILEMMKAFGFKPRAETVQPLRVVRFTERVLMEACDGPEN